MLSCVDPDQLLTRLNRVVLTKMNETFGNASDVSEMVVLDGQRMPRHRIRRHSGG